MNAVTLHASSAHDCGVTPRICVSGREGKGREGKGRDERHPHPSVTGGTSADDGCALRARGDDDE